MTKPKKKRKAVPDEKVIPLIREGKSDAWIVRVFDRSQGAMYAQLKRLREQLGIPTNGRAGRKPAATRNLPLEEGLITYRMSEEEIRKRYGPPRLLSKESRKGDKAADDYLAGMAVECQRMALKKEKKQK